MHGLTGVYTVQRHHGEPPLPFIPQDWSGVNSPEGAGPIHPVPYRGPWAPPTPRVQRMIRRFKRGHTTRPTPGSAYRDNRPRWS